MTWAVDIYLRDSLRTKSFGNKETLLLEAKWLREDIEKMKASDGAFYSAKALCERILTKIEDEISKYPNISQAPSDNELHKQLAQLNKENLQLKEQVKELSKKTKIKQEK